MTRLCERERFVDEVWFVVEGEGLVVGESGSR